MIYPQYGNAFKINSITVWHFCCVATMPEDKQQWLTRQQEMLVIFFGN